MFVWQGQNTWGTNNYDECEEIITTCECVHDSEYDLNSYSNSDCQSSYMDRGNCIDCDNSCANYEVANDYTLTDYDSQFMNENCNCGNGLGYGMYC